MISRVIALSVLVSAVVFVYAGCSGGSAALNPPSPSTSSAKLSVTPSAVTFGGEALGTTSKPQSVTLQNSGTSTLTLTGFSVSSPQFAFSSPAATNTLNPGQSTTLGLTFTPAATGNVNGSLIISSNAVPQSSTVSLSGTGM